MATDIYKSTILTGISDEAKRANQVIANSISQIHAQVNLFAEMIPYLVDQTQIPDSGITTQFLTAAATRLQQHKAARAAYLPLLDAIEQLFSADPAVQATGRATLDAFNVGKPSFDNRYTAL